MKVIGCDNGHYGIKVYAGLDQAFTIESRCRIGAASQTDFSGGDTSELVFETKNENGLEQFYTTGSLQSSLTTFDEYPLSAINRILVHSCLHQFDLSGQSLELVLGLPYSHYYSGGESGEANTKLIEGMENNIMQPVKHIGKESIEIVKCMTMPEGMAAFFSYVTTENKDQNGKISVNCNTELSKETTVFIDIGGQTTEIVTVSNAVIQKDYSTSLPLGSLRIIEDIRKHLFKRCNISNISDTKIKAGLVNGGLKVNGNSIDLTDIISKSKSKLVHDIQTGASSILKGVEGDIDEVKLLGGTAIDIKAPLTEWKKASLMEEPLYANAKGMYLYRKYFME